MRSAKAHVTTAENDKTFLITSLNIVFLSRLTGEVSNMIIHRAYDVCKANNYVIN